MARIQLLVLLVAALAYYGSSQTCTSPDSQLYVFPYSSSAGGYVNQPMAQLNVNATARFTYLTNFTWVVTQIPAGLIYNVTADTLGIYVTGTPVKAGTYTMNVYLFYYDTANRRQRCSTQPINFNFQCNVPITITPTEAQGVTGTAYNPANLKFNAAGGFGSGYQYSASLDNPMNGVNLTTDGTLVGSWTAPTTFSFYLNVVDDGNCEATFSFTAVISCPTLVLAPVSGSLPDGVTTDYYNSSVTTSAGLGPYTYWMTEVSLPTGINFAADGTVYGTPAGASSTVLYVNVEDVNKCGGNKAFDLEIKCASITLGDITNSTLVDKAYFSVVLASGGSAPYSYQLDNNVDKRSTSSLGDLPPGVTLSAAGVISGTPTATGTYTFTVIATDDKDCSHSRTYTLQVSCDDLAINDISPSGVAANPYYTVFDTIRGTEPYTYSTPDTLIKDLILTPQGVLSGELKQVGIYNITVVSTDFRSCQVSRVFTFNITCPTLILQTFITNKGQASVAYSSSVVPDDGVGPYSIDDVIGLPDGITNDGENFNFAGTPTVIGLFNVTFTATDVNGCANTFSMPLNITCAHFTFNGIDSGATVDTSYEDQFAVTAGYIGNRIFSVYNGTLPRGLTLAADGTLSGTPTLRGDFTFTVEAVDENGCTGYYTQQISVDCSASTLTVNPSLDSGQTGVYYSDSFSASGSTHTPYTYSIAPTSVMDVRLPYGVQTNVVNPDLRGWTQCYSGTYAQGMSWVDIWDCLEENNAKYMMLACGNSEDTFYNMAAGTVDDIWFETDVASNGVYWYWKDWNEAESSWGFAEAGDSIQWDSEVQCDDGAGNKRTCWNMEYEGSNLGYRCGDQKGLNGNDWFRFVYVASEVETIPLDTETYNLTSGGMISGLPNIAGDLGYIVTVTDFAGCDASAASILHIDCGKFYIQDLPAAQVTISYVQSLIISGGSGEYTATISGLPTGLQYDSEENVIYGTPITHGEYPIVIQISDIINPCSYTVHYNFTVLCPPNFLSDIPPLAKVGTTYYTAIQYRNMIAPVHFESSQLPYGLTLYRNGIIEGVPSLPGVYGFWVYLIQDAENGCTGSRYYTIEVVCGPIDISDISNNFILGDTVAESFDSSNGIQEYNYTVASGSLPDGLTLTADGNLTGTVTKAGFFRFSVRARDTWGCSGERRFVVAVTCIDPIALGPLPTVSFMAGEEVSMAPAPLGGIAPYTFQLLLGTLPRGLVLTSDGTLAGNLTTPGTFVFQLGVRDSQGCVATELYTIMVVAPPTSQPPVTAPVAAPVTAPVAAPVTAPVADAPVATGNTEPTPTPVPTPVAAPVQSPVVDQAPVPTPQAQQQVQTPAQSPAESPAVSGQSSIHSAIGTILSVCLVVFISM